jgi:hypothetical protein
MLSGFGRYLRLTAVAKKGLSSSLVVFALVAALCAATTFVLVVFAAFIWLAQRYSPLTAALILCAFFLLAAILAAVAAVMAQRRTVERANVALAARHATPWLDPSMLGVMLQVGRGIGLRRIVPLLAAGVLAAGFAKEWLRERPADEVDES